MLVRANGISIEVEERGPASGEPLLLVMGLGMQLLGWPEGLVDAYAARGFRVIRFDNRDIGLSQGFDSAGVPNLVAGAVRLALGLRVSSPYSLGDMAQDAIGVLDALGIAKAHVCGASMGGMIAQRMAERAPDRVKSLTLIMTTAGTRGLPGPSLKVRGALISRPPRGADVAAIVEHYVRLYDLIGSPGYPPDKAELRARFTESIRRAYRPAGTARQMVAIVADGDRSALLPNIAAPVHVIHGAADTLVPVAAGRDLAKRIPGATLDVVEGMGHDLPPELWARFADGTGAVAARA